MTDHSALIERLEAETVEVLAEYDDWGRPCYVSQPSELHQEAAEALRNLTEWRDIATAPKDGAVIMGAWGFKTFAGHIMTPVLFLNGQFWARKWDHEEATPTHWLPLPSAPNQAKEAGE